VHSLFLAISALYRARLLAEIGKTSSPGDRIYRTSGRHDALGSLFADGQEFPAMPPDRPRAERISIEKVCLCGMLRRGLRLTATR